MVQSLDKIRMNLIESCRETDKAKCKELLKRLDKCWPEYTDQLKAFTASRFQLGEILCNLRSLISKRGNGSWGKYQKAIGLSSSTAHTLIKDYQRVVEHKLPDHVFVVAAEMGLDIAQKKFANVLQFTLPELRKTKNKVEAKAVLLEMRKRGKCKPRGKTAAMPQPDCLDVPETAEQFIQRILTACADRWALVPNRETMQRLVNEISQEYLLTDHNVVNMALPA